MKIVNKDMESDNMVKRMINVENINGLLKMKKWVMI